MQLAYAVTDPVKMLSLGSALHHAAHGAGVVTRIVPGDEKTSRESDTSQLLSGQTALPNGGSEHLLKIENIDKGPEAAKTDPGNDLSVWSCSIKYADSLKESWVTEADVAVAGRAGQIWVFVYDDSDEYQAYFVLPICAISTSSISVYARSLWQSIHLSMCLSVSL